MALAPAFDSLVRRIAVECTWPPYLIGLALFVMPPFAIAPNAEQHALVFIVVVI
jgi:hypothetical protein